MCHSLIPCHSPVPSWQKSWDTRAIFRDNQDSEGLSPVWTGFHVLPRLALTAKGLSRGNSVISLLKNGPGECQATGQESHANPDPLLQEPNSALEHVLSSEECTFGTQDLSCEVNKTMQVDESDGLHAAGKDAKFDLITNLDNLQQSPNSNAGASFRSEPPKENAIIPVSPEEGPPRNEASQRFSDSVFCEQVYQELQQQFEDAQAKERERQIHPPKRPGTADEIPETKTPPKKKSGDSRQKLPRKPVPRATPKRGDGLSHCLARQEVNAQRASSGAANKNSVNEILRNKRRQSHFHHLKQMVSRDVSLQNMDFQEKDLQRAASLYENLNATACFYTAALRIVSKANWDKQVNFENHIGHQAVVAIAKGWTCAAQLPNDDFDHYHLALMLQPLLSLTRLLDFYCMWSILKLLSHGRSTFCQSELIIAKTHVKNAPATLIGPLKLARLVDLYGFNIYERTSRLQPIMRGSLIKTLSIQVDKLGSVLP